MLSARTDGDALVLQVLDTDSAEATSPQLLGQLRQLVSPQTAPPHLAPSERSPSETLAISRLFTHLFKAM